jgi:hypothetical protein
MTAKPEDQPESSVQPLVGGAGPSGWLDDGEFGDCLTVEELAELARQDWLADCPDPDDPRYAEENGPPALSADEWERLLADEDERARHRVAEALDAGFTHSLGGNGCGFSAGGPLDVMLPGRTLGRYVIQEYRRGPATLDDDQLIGLLAAVRRQASLDEALQLDLVAELDRRRAAADGTPGRHTDQELAAALTLTNWSATALLDLARDLRRLPKTRDLLAAGVIDSRRAAVIARHTSVLSDENAARAEDLILPRAGQMTTGELSGLCLRAVLKVDPQAAAKRKEKALKNARVETWLEDSGTAALCGRDLPPAEVIAADKRIEAIARWLKNNGAEGTLEQLGAQVYLAILNDRPIHTLLPTTPGNSTTDADSTAPQADSTSHDGSETDGSAAADNAQPDGPQPDGPQPDRAQTDRAQPDRPQPDRPQPDRPQPDNAQPDRAQPDRADTGTLGVPGPDANRPVAPAAGPGGLSGTVHLTMPYDTWQGLTDNPGEIAGYGAADASTCRDIATRLAAATTTRWCITLTDQHGRPVGHGCARAGPGPPGTADNPASWLTTVMILPIETGTCAHLKESAGYQPSNLLRHIIKVRSRRCGFPGCRRPAVRCDDDHSIPYHLGGKTCECNLHPLCRRHHQCKQAPGWHLDQPRPGELIWTSPSGRKYTNTVEPYPI